MKEIKFSMTLTESELGLIEQWKALKPKIIILDNCIITDINNEVYNRSDIDELKLNIFNYLRIQDIETNIVSLLLVILEKLCNTHTKKTESEILSSIQEYDLPNLRKFIKKAFIPENINFIESALPMIPEFKKIDINYKNFLNDVNYNLKLYNNISDFPCNAADRIKIVNEIIKFAEINKVSKNDLIVLICISKVYRLPAAQAVLKLTPSEHKFNTSNALGDILSFSRVNFLKGKLQRIPQFKNREIIFLTSDKGLHDLNKIIQFTQFNDDKREANEYIHGFEFHHKYVLHCLFNENGEIIEDCREEAIAVYNMLGINLEPYL